MDAFEFVFTLFGLLLGFSLAEVLNGFVRVTKARRKVRLGWLTPMLGVAAMIDLTTLWFGTWALRQAIPIHFVTLLFGLFVTGVYYYGASLIFPAHPEEWENLDDYYLAHRREALIPILLANVVGLAAVYLVLGAKMAGNQLLAFGYLIPMAAAVFLKGRRASLAALAALLAFYGYYVVLSLI